MKHVARKRFGQHFLADEGVIDAIVRERKLVEAYTQWAQEVRGRAYVEYREPPQ